MKESCPGCKSTSLLFPFSDRPNFESIGVRCLWCKREWLVKDYVEVMRGKKMDYRMSLSEFRRRGIV